MADMIDKLSGVTGLTRNDATLLIETEQVDIAAWSDAYLELLSVAEKRCHNCPMLAHRAIDAVRRNDLQSEKEAVHLISENRTCVYGARLVVDQLTEDVSHISYECTSEEHLSQRGENPYDQDL
ncbi:hypothetical protein COY17_00630 [Candidatus Saccharibacteria bacterium CG_4_10_14_0_2_um_filter_52_9]|nr:MAG: hypothetical protein COY17_00630 [Candidatus Saccharibacteria bacterium CG_4_10_14_0_2_um_filter_52_9]